ncbi:MAG: YihY/virulence factor BrkB family protein [Candidatus Azobacteroides sp.]|nr:YihY/virulence factor BrkB family protein [Candidatus Azobacteroides sp.]
MRTIREPCIDVPMKPEKKKKKSGIDKMVDWSKKGILFLQEGIWRVSEAPKGIRKPGFDIVKSFVMAVRRYSEDRLQNKASALTYNSLLSIVPMLAVLFGIARGFGFQNIIETQLFSFLPGQKDALGQSLKFVDSYLEQAKSGVFVGIGLALLLWTVMNLLTNIEDAFNEIWRVQKSRSWSRKFTDYLSLFLVVPVLIICSVGLSFFISSTLFERFQDIVLITPVITFFIKLIPFFLVVLTFTGIYMFIPNTRVKFLNAFGAAFVAGTVFQLFQYLYISGQIWVSKYNAIYGSFAALPLLLLWLQLSWVICLFGVELAAAGQNIESFSFEKDTRNISRRYKDFLTIMITAIIAKRFEVGLKPLTENEISMNYKIPLRLTGEILELLLKIDVLSETNSAHELVPAYQPALDINKISVGFLLNKIDMAGTEDFDIDKNIMKKYREEYLQSRDFLMQKNNDTLVKDL